MKRLDGNHAGHGPGALTPGFSALESLGAEVWEPFQRNSQVDFSQPGGTFLACPVDVLAQ